ncbi:MAG TPA: hypothetical protein VGR98_28010 [Streptosporangiaceae bacterium]|nr:hypothetical protein [Streptosporangiaceae bacterium]
MELDHRGFPIGWGLGEYTTRELDAALAWVDEQLADVRTPPADLKILIARRGAILEEITLRAQPSPPAGAGEGGRSPLADFLQQLD